VSKLRWSKWFWADWSNDTALNLCSIPARGLWMALLCIAAQGEPYGAVTIKGRAPTDQELFNLIAPRGTRRRDFTLWLAELERNGVAHRDQLGVIKSPRMSQDGVTSLARIDAAHESWKGKNTQRNPRNQHEQTVNGHDDLHEEDEIFHELESGSSTSTDPPVAPPQAGGRRGDVDHSLIQTNSRALGTNPRGRSASRAATSKNGMCDLVAEETRHVEATHPPASRPELVSVAGHLVRG
jgi:hypothetical protein